MNVSVDSIAKTEDKNEVVLTMDILPVGLPAYDTADWLLAFGGFSHALVPSWVECNKETGQLTVGFLYTEALQGQQISMSVDFSAVSPNINVSSIAVSFPEKTSNNQALFVYGDSTYAAAKAMGYASYGLSVASWLFFAVGHFGCKLQSLEGAAVVQLAALLLVTL
jgi:hypothetical protein